MPKPPTLYKLMILYMLDRVDTTMTNAQISDFILGREYTSYFHLQQLLNELLDSALVQKETTYNTSYYHITEQGKTTLNYFVGDVSAEIQEDINHFLETQGYRLAEEMAVISDYYKSDSGTYSVQLKLAERTIPLLDLQINVPNEAAAQAMCSEWKEKSHDVYEKIMDLLL